jgi:hypothetical protein
LQQTPEPRHEPGLRPVAERGRTGVVRLSLRVSAFAAQRFAAPLSVPPHVGAT